MGRVGNLEREEDTQTALRDITQYSVPGSGDEEPRGAIIRRQLESSSFLTIKDPNEEHAAENEDNRVDMCTVARKRPPPCFEAFTEHGQRLV